MLEARISRRVNPENYQIFPLVTIKSGRILEDFIFTCFLTEHQYQISYTWLIRQF
jgi:hypothetical protein